MRSFRDAFRRVGNVMDGDWNDAGFIIRGVNSEGFVPGGAPVGALTGDGVHQTVNGMRRGARGLWEFEQLEIYRGPQSTFGGRAAMAGTIAIKTKDPTFQREAEIAGHLGSNRLYGSAVMVNTPLMNNQLAVRLAAEFERSRSDLNYPTYERFSRHDDLTTDRYYNIRGKVLLTPERTPDTRALFSYSFAYDAPSQRDVASGATYDLKAKRGDFNTPTYTENPVHPRLQCGPGGHARLFQQLAPDLADRHPRLLYQSAERLTFRRIGKARAAIERRHLRQADPKGQS